MLPIHDLNPTRRFPVLTYLLIVINVLVFLWEVSMPQAALQNVFVTLSVVPAQISADPLSLRAALDALRSMFFHGGWAHLLGNMLYLYLFGDNVEDYLGKVLFLVVYFLSGLAAVAAQVVVNPASQVPLVGASGAIAGVLGSYLVLYPGVKVRGLIFLGYFAFLRDLPAWLVLGFWFIIQLFNGIASVGVPTDETMSGGVAFFAHVGGFVLGAVLTVILMQMIPHPDAAGRQQFAYQERERRPFL